MERVYSASIWSSEIKKKSNYECSKCGSLEDVQASFIVPPSLGGKRTLDNGVALCVICSSEEVLESKKVRFNFSIPRESCRKLDEYCRASGRSTTDVVKQLMADYAFDADGSFTSLSRDGRKNDKRISVTVLKTVYDQFAEKSKDLTLTEGEIVKALILRYLLRFSGE